MLILQALRRRQTIRQIELYFGVSAVFYADYTAFLVEQEENHTVVTCLCTVSLLFFVIIYLFIFNEGKLVAEVSLSSFVMW